jgi:hypothetical protein
VRKILDQKIQEFAELLASKIPAQKEDAALSAGRPETPFDPLKNIDLITVMDSENIKIIDETTD